MFDFNPKNIPSDLFLLVECFIKYKKKLPLKYYSSKISSDSKKIQKTLEWLFRCLPMKTPKNVKRIIKDKNNTIWVLLLKEEDIKKEKLISYLKENEMYHFISEQDICIKEIYLNGNKRNEEELQWPVCVHKKTPKPYEIPFSSLEKEEKQKIVYWCFFLIKNKKEEKDNFALLIDPKNNILISQQHNKSILTHATMNVIQNVIENKKRNYLCNGYDIFLYKEPCIMCSMALLHSRIRRVFFLKKNKEKGGLLSFYRLQTNKKLNHKFAVYYLNK